MYFVPPVGKALNNGNIYGLNISYRRTSFRLKKK